MEKIHFKFLNDDGKTETDVKKYKNSGQAHIKKLKKNFYKGMGFAERDWRNEEFVATDYMLLPRARYKGQILADTGKLQDIFDYRDALHEYDVEGSGDRPKRPGWFKEEERL
jgi:hypothetical protein